MPQLIRFNNGVRKTGGLDLTFTRNQATYDPLGNAIAVNTPRYGKTRALTTRAQATTQQTLTGSGNLTLRASGVQADGSSPLVMAQTSGGGAADNYRVFTGSGLTQSNIIDSTHDLMEGAIDLEAAGDTVHLWRAGIVCHGLIACRHLRYTASPSNG